MVVLSREISDKIARSAPAQKGRKPGPGTEKVPTFRRHDSTHTASPKTNQTPSAMRCCFFKNSAYTPCAFQKKLSGAETTAKPASCTDQ